MPLVPTEIKATLKATCDEDEVMAALRALSGVTETIESATGTVSYRPVISFSLIERDLVLVIQRPE